MPLFSLAGSIGIGIGVGGTVIGIFSSDDGKMVMGSAVGGKMTDIASPRAGVITMGSAVSAARGDAAVCGTPSCLSRMTTESTWPFASVRIL